MPVRRFRPFWRSQAPPPEPPSLVVEELDIGLREFVDKYFPHEDNLYDCVEAKAKNSRWAKPYVLGFGNETLEGQWFTAFDAAKPHKYNRTMFRPIWGSPLEARFAPMEIWVNDGNQPPLSLLYLTTLIPHYSERPELAWCLQKTPEWEKSLAFSFDRQVEGVDTMSEIVQRCKNLQETDGGARDAFFGAIYDSYEKKGAFFRLWRYHPSTRTMSLSKPEVSTDLNARNVESSTFCPAGRNIGLALYRIALHNKILTQSPQISTPAASPAETAVAEDHMSAPATKRLTLRIWRTFRSRSSNNLTLDKKLPIARTQVLGGGIARLFCCGAFTPHADADGSIAEEKLREKVADFGELKPSKSFGSGIWVSEAVIRSGKP
ncbi:hypothetical protein DL93DRAFT_2161666 [Clavulina sp. PMI_390]|nr:hypothetical protein DL93DRAFT_2161666 [Clavulina sp. PMI_390]